MKTWNKAISFSLAASLSLTLAACGADNNKAPSATSSDSAKPGKPVTLKVEIFDRGNTPSGGEAPNNNNWTRYIQEKFGDPNNIKLEFVTVPRSEEVSKLNVLMAAGEAPDIVFTYDKNLVYNYVSNDGLAKLDDVLNQYGPNLKKFLGEDTLKYGKFNGAQFALPAKRTVLGVRTSYIRKDWLDKLGMKNPTTRDELYQVLKAFKEKDPGNTGGKVVPFSVTLKDLAENGEFALQSFDKMSEQDFYTLPDLMKPGYKENVRFFNKLYNEKLISPNFAIDKDAAMMGQELANGYSGFLEAIPDFLKPGATYAKMKTNVPTAELVVSDPYQNNEGKHPKWLYDPVGAFHMIPKSSEHAKEAIMYLDWLSKSDNLYVLQNGIEGTHFKKNEEGFPIPIVNDESKKTFYNTNDIAMISNGKEFGSQEKNIKGAALSAQTEFQGLAVQAINNAYVDGYYRPVYDRPIKSEAKNMQPLLQKLSELLVKVITAKPADFDKLYDQGVQDYMAAGGKEVMDEKVAAYQEMKKQTK